MEEHEERAEGSSNEPPTAPSAERRPALTREVVQDRAYPGAQNGDVDVYIKPEVFPSCFANDLPAKQAAVLAASQRPITFSASAEPSGRPAWKRSPLGIWSAPLDDVIPRYLQMSWPNAPMLKSCRSCRRIHP